MRAFGWAVARCDGNDVAAVARDARRACSSIQTPEAADRRHGQGRAARRFRAARPASARAARCTRSTPARRTPDQYDAAMAEIAGRLRRAARPRLELEAHRRRAGRRRRRRRSSSPRTATRWPRPAEREPRLVALDADLYLDCGLIPFRQRFPERFVECGIAEQDMVSQAGALALGGMLPVGPLVRLLPHPARERAGLQQRHRAHEGHLRAASWPGIVPGGPGHSHQSIRDIALMGSVPGMACLEPATEDEARRCVEWAVDEADGPGLPALRLGAVGARLRAAAAGAARAAAAAPLCASEGDVVIVCTGPVLASQAYAVEERRACVLLPWLRDIDGGWLAEVAGRTPDRRARQPLGPRRPGRRRARRAARRACRGDRRRARARRAARTTRCCARTGSTRRHCGSDSRRDDVTCSGTSTARCCTTARAGIFALGGGDRGGARRAASTWRRCRPRA